MKIVKNLSLEVGVGSRQMGSMHHWPRGSDVEGMGRDGVLCTQNQKTGLDTEVGICLHPVNLPSFDLQKY